MQCLRTDTNFEHVVPASIAGFSSLCLAPATYWPEQILSALPLAKRTSVENDTFG